MFGVQSRHGGTSGKSEISFAPKRAKKQKFERDSSLQDSFRMTKHKPSSCEFLLFVPRVYSVNFLPVHQDPPWERLPLMAPAILLFFRYVTRRSTSNLEHLDIQAPPLAVTAS
jgi:hypothetical protein